MVTLRLVQSAAAEGRHRVSLRMEGDGPPVEAESEFSYTVAAVDSERLRWYLEDFLEYPLEPAPTIAAQVEQRLAELGTDLFTAVFDSDRDAQDLWSSVRGRLASVRVEVGGSVESAAVLPWELLRDPRSGRPVALEAASFVRVNSRPGMPVRRPAADGGQLRVLLVICRPAGDADVPFRSVARQLASLGAQADSVLQLDVLRPPTFAQLTRALEAAVRAGRPYQVVHFDGHGTYVDTSIREGGGGGRYGSIRYGLLSPARPGRHGYLVFEDPDRPDNEQLVDGPALGALLARTGVGVLLLNACRSAYSEAPTEPQVQDTGGDVHTEVRAYGSLALEATDAGLAGVVAMRYNVYVVTAAQFVADLYAALLAGQPLGEAVSAGRRQLAAQPNRSIAFQPRPLQDWPVPVVYESAPLALFSVSTKQPKLVVDATSGSGVDGLPKSPDVGFFGRDESLLALDRAFDRHRIVVLHAFAGSGKTSTAVEFARWYAATGGLSHGTGQPGGVVLFSSLEQYTPLSRLLNQLADTLASLLAASNVPWQALDDKQRRNIALQMLNAVPVLWVWDNVEPVAGFPNPSDSPWPANEQRELADFLRDAAKTKARVLLTSRRDEHGWLTELPARVELPRMPMRECIQLTEGLASRLGYRIEDVTDWRPLLRYTAGNPLTITMLVGQALRQGITGRDQIEGFVAKLRAGESDIDDDQTEGRSKSLAASLSYGFATAFSDAERAQLAVLHVFQDTVNVVALVLMGSPRNPHPVPELAGLTSETAIALLDRAAAIGLLTRVGGAYYTIHPALPWYLRRLHSSTNALQAQSAFTWAIGNLGGYYWQQYDAGQHQVVDLLRLDEANLLHARSLARHAGRWVDVIECMQGLRMLYWHESRRAEWARLVDDLVPELVDPATGGPKSALGNEHLPWAMLTDYRIRVARDARDWTTAEDLQHARLAYDRDRAADALATHPDHLTERQRSELRRIAVGEHELGQILREKLDPDCVAHYQQAVDLFHRIGARREEGTVAFNLGNAYLNIPQLRDLDRAENWYRRDLDLLAEHDRFNRARTTLQLGNLAYVRFLDASDAGQPDDVRLAHLNAALAAYQHALRDTPGDAIGDLAIVENQLGIVYAVAGDADVALTYWQRAIRHHEDSGSRFNAGETRYNVALYLVRADRPGEALLYARAALRDFEQYGANATNQIDATARLITRLEQLDSGASS